MPHFNHFDFIAPYYDRLIKPTDPAKMRSLIGMQFSGRLLDVGGGTGRGSDGLIDSKQGIVIADSSMGMLLEATKKNEYITVCSNSEELPFDDESFARVIVVDALHHVKDYRITIHELWRVLMPGGRIVIEEPDIQTFPVKLMALVEKIALMRSHFISSETIRSSFQFSNANTRIEKDGSTFWIVVDKRDF